MKKKDKVVALKPFKRTVKLCPREEEREFSPIKREIVGLVDPLIEKFKWELVDDMVSYVSKYDGEQRQEFEKLRKGLALWKGDMVKNYPSQTRSPHVGMEEIKELDKFPKKELSLIGVRKTTKSTT